MFRNIVLFRTDRTISRKEAIRRLIVQLVFVVYWLLIFEGALRKWMFPQFHKLLFFIRDPFVLLVYYLALRYKFWPKTNIVFSPSRSNILFPVGIIMAVGFLGLVLLQRLFIHTNLFIGLYGWRNYFLYLPLAFIIGQVFSGRDLAKLVKHTLLIAIPIAVLVFMQYKSPPSAWVNKTYNPEAQIFIVTKDIVRTTGTFTFSQGQALFVGSILAMLFTVWRLPPSERPLKRFMLLLTSAAVLTNFALSGSRGVFFYAFFAVIATIASGLLIMRNTRFRIKAAIKPLLIVLIGGFAYITIFPQAFEAMKERQEIAVSGEGSTTGRAISTLTTVVDVLPEISLIGAGIGIGSNAAASVLGDQKFFRLYENEWPRIVQEAGPLGLFYIAYRIALAIALLAAAIPATQRSGNPLPLLLISFAAPIILNGPMTLQGTANGYGWLFAGFCLAANRLRLPGTTSSSIGQPVGNITQMP